MNWVSDGHVDKKREAVNERVELIPTYLEQVYVKCQECSN